MGMRDNSFETSSAIRSETVFVDSDDVIIKDNYALDESAGEGLGGFHRNADELEPQGGKGKVIGALAVALMLGAAGAYTYSMMPAKDVVAQTQPVVPVKNAAMTPPAPAAAPEAVAPAAPVPAMTPAPAAAREAAAPRSATPAPVLRAAQAPVIAPTVDPAPAPTAVTPLESQASAVPEPVSPTPPAAAVAGNPPLNEQSAAPVDAVPVMPAAPADNAPAAEPAQ